MRILNDTLIEAGLFFARFSNLKFINELDRASVVSAEEQKISPTVLDCKLIEGSNFSIRYYLLDVDGLEIYETQATETVLESIGRSCDIAYIVELLSTTGVGSMPSEIDKSRVSVVLYTIPENPDVRRKLLPQFPKNNHLRLVTSN